MSQKAQGGASRFIREVKAGLTVLGLLCVVLIVVAYKRFTRNDELPPAIINSSKSGEITNGNRQHTGDSPATILRSQQSDDLVESPSSQGFRPAEVRKPTDYPQPHDFSPSPQPRSFLPRTEFVEPQQVTPDPENDGAVDAPSPYPFPNEQQNPKQNEETSPIGSPPGGEFRIDNSGDQPAAYVAPAAAYSDGGEETADIEPPPSARTMEVQRTDSFWMISERAYGTGAYFRALYEHNRERFPEPDRLPPGAPVDIPTLSELQSRYPKLCPDFR